MIVNGKVMNVNHKTVQQLLSFLKLDSTKVVVEVNMNIVPRASFSNFSINTTDKIEIVSFVGGG